MRKLLQLSESKKLFKYGLAAIFLVVPLYPKFPVFNIPGTYVAVRAEDFLLTALAGFWVVYFLRHLSLQFFQDKLPRVKNPWYSRPLGSTSLSSLRFIRWLKAYGIREVNDKFTRAVILFLGIGFLSVVSAVLLTKTASPHLALFHWVRRIEYLIPFFIALTAIRMGARPKFFAETLFIASFIAFAYGVGQIYLHWPVISTQNFEYAKGVALRWIPGSRVHSTFAGHYDLAAFLVLVFPIMFTFLFALRKRLEKAILFFLIILPSFWIFLQTESRISFFSFLVGVPVALWVIKKRLFIVPFLVLSILGTFTLSDLGARYRYTINVYKQKIFNEQKINFLSPPPVYAQTQTQQSAPASVLEDRSVAIRLNIEWPRALRAFAKNPLLGTGYSSISLATDNDYLRLLGEVGLAGALAFLLLLGRLVEGFGRYLRKVGTIDQESAFVGGFMGALAGLLINAAFIDVFEASKVAIIFWGMAGVAFGLVRRRENKWIKSLYN